MNFSSDFGSGFGSGFGSDFGFSSGSTFTPPTLEQKINKETTEFINFLIYYSKFQKYILLETIF
jgi:hypothetical protein